MGSLLRKENNYLPYVCIEHLTKKKVLYTLYMNEEIALTSFFQQQKGAARHYVVADLALEKGGVRYIDIFKLTDVSKRFTLKKHFFGKKRGSRTPTPPLNPQMCEA